MAVTKKAYMNRLKRMINIVKERNKSLGASCPGSKDTKKYNYEIGRTNFCETCQKIMESKDRCPCCFHGIDEAMEAAEQKIKEYFGED